MNDQERLLLLEALVEAQNDIIEKYAAILRRLATTQSVPPLKEERTDV